MKCIAIDDEPIALEIIKEHAAKIPFLQLKATFMNAMEALQYIKKEEVNLVFLDIKMPDISGIDWIRQINDKPTVIFTTAYSEYALESYEVNAIDYLLKPFNFKRFFAATSKAYDFWKLKEAVKFSKDYLFVKCGYEQIKIKLADILYLEGAGNYMTFVTVNNNKFLSRMTMAEVLEILPPSQFFRVQKSYIVALQHIEKIENNYVAIKDKYISIGTTFREDFLKRIV